MRSSGQASGSEDLFYIRPELALLDEVAAVGAFLAYLDSRNEFALGGKPATEYFLGQLVLAFSFLGRELRKLRFLFRGELNLHSLSVEMRAISVNRFRCS